MRIRKIQAVFLLLAFITSGIPQPIFVLSADSVDDLNRQIEAKQAEVKQLEQSIDDYKKKADQKRLEAVSLSNQMAILDNRIAQVKLSVAETKVKLDTLTLEIEKLQLEIAGKNKTLAKQKQMVAELLQTIHERDGKNYVQILAAHSSFSDFYNQLQYVEKVDRDLGKSVRAIRLVKEDLESKKRQTEERKQSYETLQKKLQDQQKDLEEQEFAKQDLLVKTRSSEATYQTLLKSLRQQYQSINNEISSIEKEVRRRLDEQHKLQPISENIGGFFAWPVQSRYITTYFRDPEYPFRRVFEHSGIDIRASHGTTVHAAASGYIARAKRCSTSSCYSYVMIIHGSGLSTIYGHLSQIIAREDQFVTRGDIIGMSGGTPGTVGAGPFVTGPHLHFEVRENGIPVDPLPFMQQ